MSHIPVFFFFFFLQKIVLSSLLLKLEAKVWLSVFHITGLPTLYLTPFHLLKAILCRVCVVVWKSTLLKVELRSWYLRCSSQLFFQESLTPRNVLNTAKW